MKTFLKLFIFAAAALQLSLASPVPSSNALDEPSYYHKRYELFDFFLKIFNELTSDEFIQSKPVYQAILTDYNGWLKSNQGNNENEIHLRKEFKVKLEKFLNTVEKFKQIGWSCELQRELQTDSLDTIKIRGELNNEDIDKIWQMHHTFIKTKDTEKLKSKFVNVYFKEITNKIEEFLQSLDDTGKNENVELIKWCDKFLTKADSDTIEKINLFEEFDELLGEEVVREKKAGNPNCRLIAQNEFVVKFKH